MKRLLKVFGLLGVPCVPEQATQGKCLDSSARYSDVSTLAIGYFLAGGYVANYANGHLN